MEIANVSNMEFTLADMFGDTLTWGVYQAYREELETLVPNFLRHDEPIKVLSLTSEEVESYEEQLNNTTAHLYRCLEHFMTNATDEDYERMGITNPRLKRLIKMSWDADQTAPHIHKGLFNGLYGNFDFTVDSDGKTWAYEYNGNTPVLTYESIVLQDMVYGRLAEDVDIGQFNSLSESWQALFEDAYRRHGSLVIVFGGFSELVNDLLTVETMAFSAQEAGHDVTIIEIKDDIEFDSYSKQFYLKDTDKPIDYMFGLFPWEDYDDEALKAFIWNYENLCNTGKGTVIAEPAYKLVASNKAFLAYMTALDVDAMCENGLIPTYLDPSEVTTSKYVGKPVYGRMSSNIRTFDQDTMTEDTGGEYEDSLFIYQPFFDMIEHGSDFYQLRMWVAPQQGPSGFEFAPCGLAVRKSTSANSMNVETEEFVPHIITA